MGEGPVSHAITGDISTWGSAPRRAGSMTQLMSNVRTWFSARPVKADTSQSDSPGTALGVTTPSAVRLEIERRAAFRDAFVAGAELAVEMSEADEMDPPDSDIWNRAAGLLSTFAPLVPSPLVHPLQLGGLSCEWHDRGLNIELRFRRDSTVFAVIEDARREVPEFHGRDPSLSRTLQALGALSERAHQSAPSCRGS